MKPKKTRIMLDSALLPNFFRRVKKTPSCWVWTGALANFGYGKLGTNRGQQWYAHRLSYLIFNGGIPNNMCVLHKCDNPKCVNPKHLFLGTVVDNLIDMRAKNRDARGEKHGHSKLTESEVRLIRALSKEDGIGTRALAKKFKVCRETIRKIIERRNWTHI